MYFTAYLSGNFLNPRAGGRGGNGPRTGAAGICPAVPLDFGHVPQPSGAMANPRDHEVQKLLKKLAKAGPQKPRSEFGKTYDKTAPKRVEEDIDNQAFFKEMKRRDF